MIEFDVYISKQEYNTMPKINLKTLAYNGYPSENCYLRIRPWNIFE